MKIKTISVPSVVRRGSSGNLSCSFDLVGQSLYSFNWWKDTDQFYHVSSRDVVTIFDTPGIRVNVSIGDFE